MQIIFEKANFLIKNQPCFTFGQEKNANIKELSTLESEHKALKNKLKNTFTEVNRIGMEVILKKTEFFLSQKTGFKSKIIEFKDIGLEIELQQDIGEDFLPDNELTYFFALEIILKKDKTNLTSIIIDTDSENYPNALIINKI